MSTKAKKKIKAPTKINATDASAKSITKAAIKSITKSATKSTTKSKDYTFNAQTLEATDLLTITDAEISSRSLVSHHIDSFNNFITDGIKQIVTNLFQIEKTIQNERTNSALDKEISHIHVLVKFKDVKVEKPVTKKYNSGKPDILNPNDARIGNLNYSAPLYIDADITSTAYFKDGRDPLVKNESITGYRVAQMPIMVGCHECNTAGMTTIQARMNSQEDPYEKGGEFIFGGGEWVLSVQETRLFNHEHVFHNVGHEKEIARLEFLSKPGDAYENSAELVMRYVKDGNIFITLTSHNYFKKLDIPFYVVFRLLGMTTDKEIIDNIVYGYEDIDDPHSGKRDVVSMYMLQILKKAFRAAAPNKMDKLVKITDQGRLVEEFAAVVGLSNKDNIHQAGQSALSGFVRYLLSNILNMVDKYFLPHLGLDHKSRHTKLRYLGHLIHKLLLVEREIVPSTDRDALDQKRMNAAGRSYAKSFKSEFQDAVVKPVSNHFARQYKSMSFDAVHLAHTFKNSIQNNTLERLLIKAIRAGAKESALKPRGEKHNRVSSEALHRKNQLNVLSTLRSVRIPTTPTSKQDQRADEMRRVHPSYSGYICPIQSADTGEQVGMVKQLALGANISDAGSSELLCRILLEDVDIQPLKTLLPETIHRYHLTKVLVNGTWIGCCRNSAALVKKYTEARRGYMLKNPEAVRVFNMSTPLEFFQNARFVKADMPLIDRLTTIVWNTDSNEIKFWVDAGRLLRPLLVVRNNGELDPIGREVLGSAYDPFKNTGFRQDILLTKDLVRALRRKDPNLTISTLVDMGIVEYIAPDEMKKCHIAASLDKLRENCENPLRVYTHCDIPEALLGIPALTSPYAHHNQVPRNTFQTNQVKQTCGIYSWAHPFRVDKHAFVQFYIEIPLISTLANKYIYPNGMNTVVAVACYGGHNQEDSLIFNISAAERGLFKGQHYNFIKAELSTDEHFTTPNETHTMDIKRHANYEHLRDGMVRERAVLRKNDVIIGRVSALEKPEEGKMYRDNSITYPYNEPGMVEKVYRVRGNDDEEICKVKFSSVRTMGIGDKFSSRHGQKGETGMGYNQADMLFSEDGLVPAIIMNPQAIPSRMTIGQPIEGVAAKIAAILGSIADATIFKKVDIEALGDLLEQLGCHRHGTELMYNGMTGDWLDVEIFNTPTYYQRLQKFVVDDVYSISTGPTSAITRQPLEGKANQGGLRIGEMEKDVIISHGAGHFLMEKFRDDSDGFDIYVCRTCQGRPIVNEENLRIKCKRCEDRGTVPEVVKVRSTWSSKLFIQELESCNIGVNTSVRPFEYESYE